ncbi:MAG: hypothetical protein N2Z72_05640 [Bacteroidales bacterium]|nr:hypothetical protein [Bacteroidales bacterium]
MIKPSSVNNNKHLIFETTRIVQKAFTLKQGTKTVQIFICFSDAHKAKTIDGMRKNKINITPLIMKNTNKTKS